MDQDLKPSNFDLAFHKIIMLPNLLTTINRSYKTEHTITKTTTELFLDFCFVP